jgi:hypothetical protein
MRDKIKTWNAQPDKVRKAKLGLHRGASMFEAHQKLPFALPKRYRIHPDGSIGERAKRDPPKFVTAAAESRGHAGAAKPLRARPNPARIDVDAGLKKIAHTFVTAQAKQRLHESKRDLTQQLIQGQGMNFDKANRYAKQAYAGGQERAHHLRKLRSNRPSR